MLDFETLSQVPRSAVLSLGAVLFNKDTIIDQREIIPSVRDQVNRDVNLDTILWWMDQGEEAKKVIRQSTNSPLSVVDFCKEFLSFLNLNNVKKEDLIVWSNGAGFDVPIMESLLTENGFPIPWNFWNIGCYRTLKTLLKIESGIVRTGVKHNALSDARFQAECVMKFLTSFAVKNNWS